jgi:NADPH2:quinone reductase
MRAAWYEQKGPAQDVLTVGETDTPQPGPGEVRIRLKASGVNPGDTKKREGWLGFPMSYPRVIPHSDGAGLIDAVGEGVSDARLGERVWCYGAQSYRPFGTAAEWVTVPAEQAVHLPDAVSFDVGACLGIPGITAHRAVFADGPVEGRTVLVAGAGGAVGNMATSLAAWGGATVIATVRAERDVERARRAGASHVVVLDGSDAAAAILQLAPNGVDRIIEVALGANAALDEAVIAQGGVIAAYASPDPEPCIPFWFLLFKNVTIRLIGSDDVPAVDKRRAAADLVTCLDEGRLAIDIAERFSLDRIAEAHEAVDHPTKPGRVIVVLD